MAGQINFGLLNTNLPMEVAQNYLQAQQQARQNALAERQLGLQTRQADVANQLAQYQLASSKRADEKQQAYDAYLAGVDFSSPDALAKALPGAIRAYPEKGFALQKAMREQETADITNAKSKAETVAKKFDMHRQFLPSVNDQAAHTAWRTRVIADFPGFAASIPEVFSPEVKLGLMSKSEDAAKQLHERLYPKLHFTDTGGVAGVGIDPFTGKPVSQGIARTPTPGEILTNQTSWNKPIEIGGVATTPAIVANALGTPVGGGAPVAPANALTWSGAAPVTWGQQRIPTEAAARAAMGNPAVEPRDTQAQALDVAGNIVAQREAARTGQATPTMQAPAKTGGIPGIKLDQKEKPLPQNVVEQIQTTRTNADNLDKLTNTFKTDFASKGFFGFGADKSLEAKGVLGTDKDAVQWWKEYKKQAELVERHAMFGASLTPGEQASWRSADISPGMDADVIRRNLTERAALAKKVFANTTQDWIDAGHPAKQIQAIAGRSSSSGAGTRSVAGAISLDDYLKSKGH